MPKFVQIVEFKTSQPDEIRVLSEKFRADRGGHPTTPARATITEDRDNPGLYRTIAEFDSYDAAMTNSKDPATQEFAKRMIELCDGPPKFYNLDVVFEMTR